MSWLGIRNYVAPAGVNLVHPDFFETASILQALHRFLLSIAFF
jgi:hypothetical protein